MSAVPSRKQFVWQVVAPDNGARAEMEEWIRRGGFGLLERFHTVEGEQRATVTAELRITPREIDVLKTLAAHDEVPDLTASQFNVVWMPRAYLVSPDGRLLWIQKRIAQSPAAIEQEVRAAGGASR